MPVHYEREVKYNIGTVEEERISLFRAWMEKSGIRENPIKGPFVYPQIDVSPDNISYVPRPGEQRFTMEDALRIAEAACITEPTPRG
jgi:hypothetical protein